MMTALWGTAGVWNDPDWSDNANPTRTTTAATIAARINTRYRLRISPLLAELDSSRTSAHTSFKWCAGFIAMRYERLQTAETQWPRAIARFPRPRGPGLVEERGGGNAERLFTNR